MRARTDFQQTDFNQRLNVCEETSIRRQSTDGFVE